MIANYNHDGPSMHHCQIGGAVHRYTYWHATIPICEGCVIHVSANLGLRLSRAFLVDQDGVIAVLKAYMDEFLHSRRFAGRDGWSSNGLARRRLLPLFARNGKQLFFLSLNKLPVTAEDIARGRLGYPVFEPTAHCGLEDPAMWIIRLILLTNITRNERRSVTQLVVCSSCALIYGYSRTAFLVWTNNRGEA